MLSEDRSLSLLSVRAFCFLSIIVMGGFNSIMGSSERFRLGARKLFLISV